MKLERLDMVVVLVVFFHAALIRFAPVKHWHTIGSRVFLLAALSFGVAIKVIWVKHGVTLMEHRNG